MGNIVRASLMIGILGVASPAYSQDLKQDGVLKQKGGQTLAALALAPDDRIVVAYVANGSEGEKAKKINWAEVRLLDVAAGKYRVLARASTPDTLPGIGANYTLHGFTTDGKKVVVSSRDPGGKTTKILLDIAEPKKPGKGDAPKGKAVP